MATRASARSSGSPHPRGSTAAYRSAVEAAVSDFGATVAPRLRSAVGSSEDNIRGPFERLLTSAGQALGLTVVTHGETRLAPLAARPDYAVDVGGARVGVVELKAPGKGVPRDGRWGDKHDREQWQKLRTLPNVLYSDGAKYALYRWGEPVGGVAELAGDLARAGEKLRPADDDLARVIQLFLLWEPEPPRNLAQLIQSVAGLCRLLRDEISDTIAHENSGRADQLFTRHLADWQQWLFPQLSVAEFADSYAQTVTFGLLLARWEGVIFEGLEIPDIGERLAKRHLLVGRALSVLTARPDRQRSIEERSVVLQTMRRVIGAVDWSKLPAQPETFHWLYETFLESYDPRLRQQSGSYYTPQPVTAFMVNFVDDILRTRLGRPRGIAEHDVTVVDPAMGTGTFLLSVVERVREVVEAERGDVPASLRALLARLIGFERQIGPYAVAELKLHQTLALHSTEAGDDDVRFYVTDTLDDPHQEVLHTGAVYRPLAQSREQANLIKTDVPVMVVLGNPPYLEQAKSLGGWILAHGRGRRSLLDDFRGTGTGRHEYKLHNLSVYFWRWATWKVFEANRDHAAGIVAFITTSAYTTGPGFAGMREYLRRNADEGWIIDLSPEGHQPSVSTRIFPKVQQPICIGIFVRTGAPRPSEPARVRYLAVDGSHTEKLARLVTVDLTTLQWRDCPSSWGAPFLPIQRAHWSNCPSLGELMPWTSAGVKPNRTWVHAPSIAVLHQRWGRLTAASSEEKPQLLKETDDRKVDRVMSLGLDTPVPARSLANDTEEPFKIKEIAFRSFDRQFLIFDQRVIDRVRPKLWHAEGINQIFISTQHGQSLTAGPGLVFCSLVPDTDHFIGHHGGRVLPLHRDSDGAHPNLAPYLLSFLTNRLGLPIPAKDVVAYLAGVLSHSGYTAKFAQELKQPGVRVPITADPELWTKAVRLGEEVIWLHTYGERFIDPAKNRPAGPPRANRPAVIVPIPGSREDMPDEIHHDPDTQILHVGAGQVHPVSPAVWEYEVSGMKIVRKWFGYRQRNPRGRRSSELDDINADRWTIHTTDGLLDLLAVLERCVALEPTQAHLLEQICDGPLITTTDLETARVLPAPPSARKPMSRTDPAQRLL